MAAPQPTPRGASTKVVAQRSTRAVGDCGSGKGGFKPGNTCGVQKGAATERPAGQESHRADSPATPAVQTAHHRQAKGERLDRSAHSLDVEMIRSGRDASGRVAKGNPKAKADADAIKAYTPAAGHAAIGLKPARPTAARAAEVAQIASKQRRGEHLSEAELHALADREVSHVGVRDRWDDSDIQGHRYLVHDRRSGRNEIHSDASLQAAPEKLRAVHRGDEAPSPFVVTRQFDSQGVEVPVDPIRFARSVHPTYKINRAANYHQDRFELARERKQGKGVRRAKFGTGDPLVRSKTVGGG